eukprot:scaffold45361_cov17-Tisochrysis_lutea.AAC.1
MKLYMPRVPASGIRPGQLVRIGMLPGQYTVSSPAACVKVLRTCNAPNSIVPVSSVVRAEAEIRVAKMEVFELKSAESVRSNTAHREDSAKDELAAENKALTAEVSKL